MTYKYIYKLVEQKDIFDVFDIYLIKEENSDYLLGDSIINNENNIVNNKENINTNLKDIINKNFNNINIKDNNHLKEFTFSGELFDVKEICKAANDTLNRVKTAIENNTYQERKPFEIKNEKIGPFAKFKIGKDLFSVFGFSDNVYETDNYSDASKVCNFLNKIWIKGNNK